jgi:hypothetical protein
MTWTIYNNDKAWGFLSEVEKFAFLLHWKPGGIILAHSFETGWVNLDLSLQFKGTVKQPSDYPNRVYRAAPEPTPAIDTDQTAQLDTANARIAELEAALGAGYQNPYISWDWVHYTHKTQDNDDVRNNAPYFINGWTCGDYTILRQASSGGLFLLRTPDGKGQIATPYKSAAMQAAKDHLMRKPRTDIANDPNPTTGGSPMFTALIMVCNLQGDCAAKTDGIPHTTRAQCEEAVDVGLVYAAANSLIVIGTRCVSWGKAA